MKRIMPLFFMLMLCATAAHAGVIDKVKDWVSGELVAMLLGIASLGFSAWLKVLHNKNANVIGKISQTSTETGEFLVAVGKATADPNVTKEELSAVFKEGADVVNIYRKTPPKYTTGPGNPEPPRAIMQ